MAFVACTQENELDNNIGLIELKCNLEESEIPSRVGFANGTGAFFWTKGDKIGVTTSSSTSFQPMTLSGEGGSAQGTFTATMSGTPSGYAVYPYGEEGRHSLSGDVLTYTLPSEYNYDKLDETYADANGNSHNAPMWAKISNGTAFFKHLGGVFAININGLPENSENLRLTLMASDKVSGDFTTTLTDNEPKIETTTTNNGIEKTITIKFNTAEGQTTGYFYLPLPTGEYRYIVLTVHDSENTEIATGRWDNFRVNRKNIIRTTIETQSLTGGVSTEVENISQINNNILNSTAEQLTVQVTQEVQGENTITIPQALQTEVTAFYFNSVADNAVISFENGNGVSYTGKIIIEIPENETIPQLIFDIPEGEVYIKQGTVTKLVTSSADNTTIIGKATIQNLIVNKGNVRIENRGVVNSITRGEGNNAVIYVIYEGTLPTGANSDETIIYVSADDYDLMKFVKNENEFNEALKDLTITTILLGKDFTISDTLLINRELTLDLNGYTISQESNIPMAMIANYGDLIIKDSSKGNGKIKYTFNGTTDGGKAANAIANRGNLTIEGGEISNTGAGNQIGYAIDNLTGATLVVNGGKITASGSSYYDGIRLFCGSNKETTVTVNDGVISTIWAQNPSNNKATEVKGTVIINGSKIDTVYYENYTIVKVLEGQTCRVSPYGAGSENTTSKIENGYTIYSFNH